MSKISVDKQTGEIVLIEKPYLVSRSVYSLNTKDDILQHVKERDSKHHYTTQIDYAAIVDATKDKLTHNELSLLSMLCEGVFTWNFFSGDVTNMSDVLSNVNLRRDISSLESKGYVRVIRRGDGVSKGSILLSIHPWFVWKGDTKYKDHYLKAWYVKK